jgi:transcriptional regulator with XRE-family HTH domain
LAERIGVSFQQIQKYEKGATRITVMRLQQISGALGVNITVFFEGGEKNLQGFGHLFRSKSLFNPHLSRL